ncbi:MAG: PadR family transcriptional regulator [Synechococcales cyanobacterium C42_A2020_086]|jgi:DNA-binding PadR family transcriptional regulator|nr:PadR family transcriptional regulator [Synechococcales cyanobacterium C42_A2020_086]
MSLAYVILGLLEQQPMTGYDLKTSWFDDAIAHLWPADQAQIYRTLDKLEQQGWIACQVEVQPDRPNRKVYSVTEGGRMALQRWLHSFQPLPVIRDPLLVQLHFAANLPNADIVTLLEQQQAARREALAHCQAVAKKLLTAGSGSREQQLRRYVVEFAIQREQLYLDWLMQMIAELRSESPSL